MHYKMKLCQRMNQDKMRVKFLIAGSMNGRYSKLEPFVVAFFSDVAYCYPGAVKFLLNWNSGKQLDKLKLTAFMHLCISF